MKTTIIASLLTLALVSVSSAAPTATLLASYNTASWGIWLLSMSSGDNDGVASVVFKVGNTSATNNTSPKSDSFIGDDSGVVDGTFGFSGEHANDLMSANIYEFRSSIKAADVTNNTPYLLRHMGQQTVHYTITNDDGSTTNKQIPNQMLTMPNYVYYMGDLTGSLQPFPGGDYPAIKLAQGALLAGQLPMLVYYPTAAIAGINYIGLGENQTHALAAGDIIFLTIPEPATIALLAVGGLVTLIRRRKK